jgi:pimeloyl-ACP methyl ester carboxylesterase
VQISHDGLTLNGDLELRSGQTSPAHLPIFLLVHGTWAHLDMEIIDTLQSILSDHEQSSLAITLSLGVDDRHGFLGCDAPVRANYEAAVDEIDAWVRWLQARGWNDVVLVGHSRGGAQVALYEQRRAPDVVSRLVLLAPLVWRGEDVRRGYDAGSRTPLAKVLAEARSSEEPLIGPYPILSCPGVLATPESFISYYDPSIPRHTPDIIRHLNVPVSVYLGSDDQIAVWSPDDLAAVAERPDIRLVTIDGADHFFRDLYLDEVVEDLLSPTR